jgi:hypothetical protein
MAALKSDSKSAASPTYNSGGFFRSRPSDSSGTEYNLGSINLYNYDADGGEGTDEIESNGPVPYGDEEDTFSPVNLKNTPPASNVIFLAGRALSGDASWEVEIPRGMTLEVLRK